MKIFDEENQQKLLETKSKNLGEFRKPFFWERFKYSFKKTTEKRIIKPKIGYYPRGLLLSSNELNNTKFSFYSFIFIFLYFEFSDFSNVYYLLLTLTQFVPAFEVGFKISYIFPLTIILIFRACEEIFQHFRILNRDKKINDRIYYILTEEDKFVEIKAKDLKVGDIIKIKGERVPADVFILASE